MWQYINVTQWIFASNIYLQKAVNRENKVRANKYYSWTENKRNLENMKINIHKFVDPRQKQNFIFGNINWVTVIKKSINRWLANKHKHTRTNKLTQSTL